MMLFQNNLPAYRYMAITIAVSVSLIALPCKTVQAESNDAPLLETQKLEAATPDNQTSVKTTIDAESVTTKASSSLSAEVESEFKTLPKKTQRELKARSEAILFEAKAVNNELRDDEELSVNDIAMLWQAAVERSGTIRYAIEKLSRRDATGESVNQSGLIKKVTQGAVSIAGLAGSAVTGSPAGLISGNMLQNLLLDDPTNSAFNRVTDADMIILAKEVENLQQRVIEHYYQYIHCEKRYKLTEEALSAMNRHVDHAANNIVSEENEGTVSDASVTNEAIMSALVQSAKQDQNEARQAYMNARNELSLLVGSDAIQALEESHRQDNQG